MLNAIDNFIQNQNDVNAKIGDMLFFVYGDVLRMRATNPPYAGIAHASETLKLYKCLIEIKLADCPEGEIKRKNILVYETLQKTLALIDADLTDLFA
jgi:hypothetical protein